MLRSLVQRSSYATQRRANSAVARGLGPKIPPRHSGLSGRSTHIAISMLLSPLRIGWPTDITTAKHRSIEVC
jgi:hypothetical protein